VSWIVAPANFSDHPGSPWYGAWYLSETLDILTRNPEVWRKTIFVLCYDENDGYFDHVPPFVPPRHNRPETGKVSVGIDTSMEYVRREQNGGDPSDVADPIGLGFRVPLVIASPWSRGGYVCSEVFDHTSVLRFLELFLKHKKGKPIQETNISAWRRTVCGDLTSVFRSGAPERAETLRPIERDPFLESIHQAQFQHVPDGYHKFSTEEIAQIHEKPGSSSWLPRQEKGLRPSCALPYELSVEGGLSADRKFLAVEFAAGRELFGDRSAGAPFHAYAPSRTIIPGSNPPRFAAGRTWDYAVSAGDRFTDHWPLDEFEGGQYHLRVHGPNGFFREFRGSGEDPMLAVRLEPVREGGVLTGGALVKLVNSDLKRAIEVAVDDPAYGSGQRTVVLGPVSSRDSETTIRIDLGKSFSWYDLRIQVKGVPGYERRYSGRIETGQEGFSDPAMSGVTV
jgi:phospholipase C